MFNRVLVGVDGQPGGRDAVALARQLTAHAEELTLTHVYPDHGDPPVPGYDDHEAAQITQARHLLGATSTRAGLDANLRWTGARSPGRGLRQLAETVNADLLVVGSTRHGPLGRMLVGDDARDTLDMAPCAVAIAPTGYAEQPAPIRKLGVGYNGSADSERALVAAKGLATELGAKLATLQATGQAARELALWSASLDLLVVGSRGFGPIGRLVHGSTSRQLTRRARCPLLVITRAHRGAVRGGLDTDMASPREDQP